MGAVDGKIAVVTGASRGIGAGIAQRLGAEGALVVVTARTLSGTGRGYGDKELVGSVEETVKWIESKGGKAVGIQCDVSDPASRAKMADEVLGLFGRVDILVNNAVGMVQATYDRISSDEYDWMWQLAVKGPFDLIQRFAPGMAERGHGWIVNLTSKAAEHPVGPPFPQMERAGGMMMYGAAKAALNRMTAGLAAEFEEKGVAVNALAPVSLVWTPGAAASGLEKYRSMPNWQEEPVETMAEAALALATVDPTKFSGHTVYSGDYLNAIGRKTRALDGKAVLEGWRPVID